jgi:Cd2+/Zn2+-exporting ATPase
MSAVNIQSQHRKQTEDSGHSNWLSQEWLEPRLVGLTLLALISGVAAEHAGAPGFLVTGLALIAYLAGGVFGVKEALSSLVNERQIDVDMLMVLAALGAASIGQWAEGATLLFLFSLSNVLQDYAIGRSRRAIRGLFKLYPEDASVRRNNEIITLPVNAIQRGDVVIIKPGERIPVDGEVINGHSAVDEAPITGESMPVIKDNGDVVFAGTLNGQGTLDVRATKLATDTTLARIIHMVENAQDNQAPTERFLDNFEQYYALFIIVAVGLFIVIPPLFGWVGFESNFYRAMVLITVASPCALVISVPASFISAIAAAARGGVLFKGGAHLEQLADIDVIAFDKTGTLTIGKPRLTDIVAHNSDDETLLRLAAAVESRSEHPLARAIVQAADERRIAITEIDEFEAVSGRGVKAHLHGDEILVGSVAFLNMTTPLPDTLATRQKHLEEAGKTTMGVLQNGVWRGLLAVADTVRPEAKAVIADLRSSGIEVAMLTGDNPRVAASIGGQLGITEIHAGLMPEDKVTILEDLRARYGDIAMVGDGVNDAPALATANIGIAMGAAGTDVALETADLVLMGDKLERLRYSIDLSQKARRVVWQNIVFSLAVIVLLVAGAFLINLPLPLGVLAHEGSTVIVVLNGLITLLLLPEIQRRRNEKKMSQKAALQGI